MDSSESNIMDWTKPFASENNQPQLRVSGKTEEIYQKKQERTRGTTIEAKATSAQVVKNGQIQFQVVAASGILDKEKIKVYLSRTEEAKVYTTKQEQDTEADCQGFLPVKSDYFFGRRVAHCTVNLGDLKGSSGRSHPALALKTTQIGQANKFSLKICYQRDCLIGESQPFKIMSDKTKQKQEKREKLTLQSTNEILENSCPPQRIRRSCSTLETPMTEARQDVFEQRLSQVGSSGSIASSSSLGIVPPIANDMEVTDFRSQIGGGPSHIHGLHRPGFPSNSSSGLASEQRRLQLLLQSGSSSRPFNGGGYPNCSLEPDNPYNMGSSSAQATTSSNHQNKMMLSSPKRKKIDEVAVQTIDKSSNCRFITHLNSKNFSTLETQMTVPTQDDLGQFNFSAPCRENYLSQDSTLESLFYRRTPESVHTNEDKMVATGVESEVRGYSVRNYGRQRSSSASTTFSSLASDQETLTYLAESDYTCNGTISSAQATTPSGDQDKMMLNSPKYLEILQNLRETATTFQSQYGHDEATNPESFALLPSKVAMAAQLEDSFKDDSQPFMNFDDWQNFDDGQGPNASQYLIDEGQVWQDQRRPNEGTTYRVDRICTDEVTANHIKTKGIDVEKRGDIGYNLPLDTTLLDSETREEGTIVAVVENECGQVILQRLSDENIKRAVLIGVITRSAYLKSRIMEREGASDAICILGFVKVFVRGPINFGEVVLADPDMPGVGVSKKNWERRQSANPDRQRTPHLVGTAAETLDKHTVDLDEVNKVKCLVSLPFTRAYREHVQHVRDSQRECEDKLTRSKTNIYKRTFIGAIVATIFLILLGVMLHQFVSRGTAFQYAICRINELSSPPVCLRFNSPLDGETIFVKGYEFKYSDLKKKLGLKATSLEQHLKIHRDHPSVHYYLNVDRCAYLRPWFRNRKENSGILLRGIEVFAISENSTIYGIDHGHWDKFKKKVKFIPNCQEDTK